MKINNEFLAKFRIIEPGGELHHILGLLKNSEFFLGRIVIQFHPQQYYALCPLCKSELQADITETYINVPLIDEGNPFVSAPPEHGAYADTEIDRVTCTNMECPFDLPNDMITFDLMLNKEKSG